MKPNNIKLTLASISLAILGVLVVACKDEVLVPVVDTKKADSIIAVIRKLDQQVVTINTKENTITVQNAVLNRKLDSLNNSFYSNPRKIQYTVYLINAGNTITTTNNGGRTTGVDGATVTILVGGKTLTATSADGRVIFEGLGGGNATVQISAAGLTPVTYQTYFFNDNRSSFGDGAVRVASTNILLFPTTNKDAVTVTGRLFANKSTLDDTLGRQYTQTTDASRYLKYISNPGISSYLNYTQSTTHTFSTAYTNYPYNAYSHYGGNAAPTGTTVKYDPITSLNGAAIVGYPDLYTITDINNYYYLDFNVPGQLLSVTYTGLTSVATVDNTGKYTLKVVSFANFPAVNIVVGHFTDSHTWLTSQNTIGSTKITMKSFDPTTYVTTSTDFYKSTTNWIYRASISQESSASVININIDSNEFGPGPTSYQTTSSRENGIKPGASITRNIFFFATSPAL
jgi:hypothetical protein